MTANVGFGHRLHAAIEKHGQLCVGIDPTRALLTEWGLANSANGALRFALRMVEAAAGVVPIVKPQSAYFERFGAAGIRALEETCRTARASGLLVLLDAKRGDIGATNGAYAEAYLDKSSPLQVDALTVAPYVGVDALAPLFDAALENDAGLFVLARTSNPEGAVLQSSVDASGRMVARQVLVDLAARNRAFDWGPFGCVFGATVDTDLDLLNGTNSFILAPGIGAQGASASDLATRFAQVRQYVLPSASRSIAGTGPHGSDVRSAIEWLRDECSHALSAGTV